MCPQQSPRTRNALGAQLFSLLTIVVLQIIQVPIYLHYIGVDAYGSYLVLIAIPSAVVLADLGLLAASSTRLIVVVAGNELAAARSLARSVLGFLLVVCSVLFICGVVLVQILDLGRPGISGSEAAIVVLEYTAYAVLSVLTAFLECVLRAGNLYVRAWMMIACMRLVDFAASVVALAWTTSIAWGVLAMVVSRVFGLFLLVYYVRTRLRWVPLSPKRPARADLHGLLRPTMGSFALPAGNALVNQGMILAVSSGVGSSAVVTFTAVRTLMNLLRQVTNVVSNAALPSITRQIARGQETVAHSTHRRIVQAVVAAGTLALVILPYLGPAVISQWTHGAVLAGGWFMLVMTFQAVLEASATVAAVPLIARNRQFGYSMYYLALSALTVGVAVATAPQSLTLYGLMLCALWLCVLVAVVGARRRVSGNAEPDFEVVKTNG